MRVVQSLQNVSSDNRRIILTMGNFDGVHIGHQALIREVVRQKGEKKGTAVVLTFQPHPVELLFPEKKIKYINNVTEMTQWIASLGIDYIVTVPFTQKISELDPEQFLKQVICGCGCPLSVVIGEDHRFGKNREGDAGILLRFAQEHKFDVTVMDQIMVDDEVVSSSRIRRLVKKGDLISARRLLGRYFRLSGIVQHGFGRGADLGFPTANLTFTNRVLPPPGVYASRAGVKDVSVPSISYIGNSPTFREGSFQVETHIFGIQQNLYGKILTVDFIERIRPEIRFESPVDLIRHMTQDAKKVMSIYKKHF
jgi:riboflavin kinase / FMN adenylyltransferase